MRFKVTSVRVIDMDWKMFLTIFGAVLVAELGDKTQLATMLFATDREVSKFMVFIAASLALVVASALGVLAGSLLSEYINEKYLHYIAGTGFIAIGAVTLYNA
jgi:putative Ca2+/H+ antiporter (TMEM165/GDT1 family)